MPIQNRFSHVALEDLKQYQTSSSDKNFTKAMENNILDFKFEILKTFKTSKYAYIYEAYLHNKYDAANNPRFINRRNEVIGSIYDGMSVWDCKLRKVIKINNIYNFDKKNNTAVLGLFDRDVKLSNNRYCKLQHKEYFCRQENNPYNIITLFYNKLVYNIFKKDLNIFCEKHKIHTSLFTDKNRKQSNGFFLNKQHNDMYYMKKDEDYIVYDEYTSYNINKDDIKKFMQNRNINSLHMLLNSKEGCNGYFSNEEDKNKYYNKIHIYGNNMDYIVNSGEIKQFLKEHKISSFNTIISGTSGYFLDNYERDKYYKSHVITNNIIDIVISHNTRISFCKSSLNIFDFSYDKLKELLDGSRNIHRGFYLKP